VSAELMTPAVDRGGSLSEARRPSGFFAARPDRVDRRGGRVVAWSYLWVAVGGALGSVARFGCSGFVAQRIGEVFPWGTLVVNVFGSFVIGFFGTLTGPDGRYLVGTETRQFVMIGFCGGFTTFSSFSLQTLILAQDGELLRASGNIVGSVALCLGAVWLGHIAAAAINR
jgi:CrcB protein